MSDFKEKCVEYFGTSDFYEVLKVDKDASVKESKCNTQNKLYFENHFNLNKIVPQ